MTEYLLPFLGRMHPVLVHLPIGILIFGILLCFFPQKEKNALLPSIRLAFLIGGYCCLGGRMNWLSPIPVGRLCLGRRAATPSWWGDYRCRQLWGVCAGKKR